MNRAQVVLLTRQGCSLCERTAARLAELADELGFDLDDHRRRRGGRGG